MEPYLLDPDKVRAATEVDMWGIVGERHRLTLDRLDDERDSAIAYNIAAYWVFEMRREA